MVEHFSWSPSRRSSFFKTAISWLSFIVTTTSKGPFRPDILENSKLLKTKVAGPIICLQNMPTDCAQELTLISFMLISKPSLILAKEKLQLIIGHINISNSLISIYSVLL